MAFTTGTATDHNDLLDKLRLYLVAQGWTQQSWSAGATVNDPSELFITGPGIVGGQPVHLSFKTEADSTTAAYAWRMCGHPDYDSGLEFGSQVNNSPIKYFLLWNNSIDYWFYVNDRRVIVIGKIGSYYMSMYCGFFLPYALPTEYPFPYYIGGNYFNLRPYNYDASGVRSFNDPGVDSACYLIRDTLTWRSVYNSNSSLSAVDSYSSGRDGGFTWPYRSTSNLNTSSNTNNLEHQMNNLRPTLAGKMPLWQVHIMDSQEFNVAGILDGVFATGGFNRGPEQVLTIDAQDYRLFLNIGRSTPRHFFAVEES